MRHLIHQIREHLTDDLRQKRWRGNVNPMAGHCYVASEAAWHLLGGKESGWVPCWIRVGGVTHWYLKHEDIGILDITADQFDIPVDYSKGKGCGFLTKNPSKRTKIVLSKVESADRLPRLIEAAKMWLTSSAKYDSNGRISRAYGGLTFKEFLISMGFTEDDYQFYISRRVLVV